VDLDNDLDEIHQQILLANQPEDLFGVDDVVLPAKYHLRYLARKYEKFDALVDPARYTAIDDQEAASEAKQKLDLLYAEACERISRFHYGLLGYGTLRPHASHSFEIGANRYYLGSRQSDASDISLYRGYLERERTYLGEVTIKLARDHHSNHLLQREARAIDLLHKQEVPQWKHLPLLLDRFESAGRTGLIFRTCYGLSLTDVRRCQAHLKGVDQRHVVWMLDRTLSCLGYVHRCGIVHGGLTPERLIINDRLHNVFIDGWEVSIHNPALTNEKWSFRPMHSIHTFRLRFVNGVRLARRVTFTHWAKSLFGCSGEIPQPMPSPVVLSDLLNASFLKWWRKSRADVRQTAGNYTRNSVASKMHSGRGSFSISMSLSKEPISWVEVLTTAMYVRRENMSLRLAVHPKRSITARRRLRAK
jgi:hypothetical protein